MLINTTKYQSPNHSTRAGRIPDRIVNHITAGSTASGAIATLCNPVNQASAHFMVDRDGTVYQLVPLERMAWCNGTATSAKDKRYYGLSTLEIVRRRGGNANAYTISIEHVNTGGGALTPAQLAATIELHRHIIAEVKRIYGVTLPADREHILGHCQINPVTKPNCPGKDFPYHAIIEGVTEMDIQSDTHGIVQIKRGAHYTARFSGPGAEQVSITSGTGGVVAIVPINKGADKLAAIVPIGKVGDAAGIYTTLPGKEPVKQFIAQIV